MAIITRARLDAVLDVIDDYRDGVTGDEIVRRHDILNYRAQMYSLLRKWGIERDREQRRERAMNLEEHDPVLAEELRERVADLERIWLQVYKHDDWTWCRHPVEPDDGLDIEYVRADLYEEKQKEAEAELKNIEDALANCGISGIYGDFAGPADAIQQMSRYIRKDMEENDD